MSYDLVIKIFLKAVASAACLKFMLHHITGLCYTSDYQLLHLVIASAHLIRGCPDPAVNVYASHSAPLCPKHIVHSHNHQRCLMESCYNVRQLQFIIMLIRATFDCGKREKAGHLSSYGPLKLCVIEQGRPQYSRPLLKSAIACHN